MSKGNILKLVGLTISIAGAVIDMAKEKFDREEIKEELKRELKNEE